jgi:hypothetical protein
MLRSSGSGLLLYTTGARYLMNDVFDRMGDPDGNFVEESQGPSLHSCGGICNDSVDRGLDLVASGLIRDP